MNKRSRITLYNNEKGYTLVIVLMIIMVFSVIGLSLMATSMNSVKMSAGEREDQSVFYIAEAALNTEILLIEQKINEVYTNNNEDEDEFYESVKANIEKSNQDSTATFEDTLGNTPRAEITVTELNKNSPRDYKLTANGFIGHKERVIEQKFSIEWKGNGNGSDLEGVAISVKNNVLLDGKVKGDIITSKKAAGSINVGWDIIYSNQFEGVIYVPESYGSTAISLKQDMRFNPQIEEKKETAPYLLPSFPIIPSYPAITGISYDYISPKSGNKVVTLDKNSEMGILKVTNSHTLTINVTGAERELVLEELHLSGSGRIVISGTGKLKIYVKDKLSVANSALLNPRTPTEQPWQPVNLNNAKEHLKKLEIFYEGTEEFSVDGQLRIYASIYAKTANISISGSAGIFGNIFSGGDSFKVTGTGNAQPSLYFAPNANFDVSGTGRVQGTIIGNSIEIKGGGKVYYEPFLINEGFFNPKFGGSAVPEVTKKPLIEI